MKRQSTLDEQIRESKEYAESKALIGSMLFQHNLTVTNEANNNKE